MHSESEMLAFEESWNVLSKRFPLTALCQYDAREFDGQGLLSALRAHVDLFSLGLGSFLA
jgi:hypothetical protein